MIPLLSALRGLYRCIPRESGDDPMSVRMAAGGQLYSPRERG